MKLKGHILIIGLLCLCSCYALNPRPEAENIEHLMNAISAQDNLESRISLPFWNGILPDWESKGDSIQVGFPPYWIREKSQLLNFLKKPQGPHVHEYQTQAQVYPLNALKTLAPRHFEAMQEGQPHDLSGLWVAQIVSFDKSTHQHLPQRSLILVRWEQGQWRWAGILG